MSRCAEDRPARTPESNDCRNRQDLPTFGMALPCVAATAMIRAGHPPGNCNLNRPFPVIRARQTHEGKLVPEQ
jgi:hypothetical protein